MSNVGKLQQTQQMASLELLKEQNVKDAKKVKEHAEQVDPTENVEQDRVGDATQGSTGGGKAFLGQKKEEEEEDAVPPSADKGKIIDTLG